MPFAQVPGVRLYYEEAGQGAPVILAHGGFSDISAFDSQASALSRMHRFIRYDRRGCGRSEPKEVSNTADLWVEDHRAFMKALGLDSAIVGGVSFGGMLTIELSIRHPGLVKGAIIVSATAGGFEGGPGYDVPFPNRLEELEQVNIPALVIHGRDDDVFPTSDAEAIAGALPNAELRILKGGHNVNEDNPDEFNSAVLDWLGRLPAS